MSEVIDDVRGMKEGDEAALERIIDRYLPLVKGVSSKVLSPAGQRDLIAECVNDIFFSIWKNIGKFTGESEGDVRNWICAVAKYRAVDMYRKAVKEAVRFERDAIGAEEGSAKEAESRGSAEESAEAAALRREELAELEKLMNLLSPSDREIFIMKFFWGMKSDEISRRVGLSRTAVDNRVSRGRKKLLGWRNQNGEGGAGI